MTTTVTLVVLAAALAMLLGAVVLLRAESPHPWPAIVGAAVASAVCFTVGGVGAGDTSGPNTAIVAGSVAGLLSVISAAYALVPRSVELPAPRSPMLVSTAGIVFASLGLILSAFTS